MKTTHLDKTPLQPAYHQSENMPITNPTIQYGNYHHNRPINNHLFLFGTKRMIHLSLFIVLCVAVFLISSALALHASADGQGKPVWEEEEAAGWDNTFKKGDMKFFNDTFWLGGSTKGKGVAVWSNQGDGWHLTASHNSSGGEYDVCAFDRYTEDEESYFLAAGNVKNLGIDIFFYRDGNWNFADGVNKEYDPENSSGTYDKPFRVLSVDTGDIDHDGNTDLVAGYLNGGIRIWFGDGKGHWQNKTALWRATTGADLDGDYYSVNLWDFDDNGDLDIVSCHKDNAEDAYLDVFLGDSAGNWVYQRKIDTWDATYDTILLEDLDDDDDLDFICNDPNKDGIAILLNKERNSTDFADEMPTTKDKFSSLASGDLDFDGYIDIVASYKDSPANPEGIQIYYGNEGEGEQGWEQAEQITSTSNYNDVFLSPSYEELASGGPSPAAHDLYIVALNSENTSRCVVSWKTSQPRVKEVSISEEHLFPWITFYDLNVTVTGGSLTDGCENIDTLHLRLTNGEDTVAEFIWHEDGAQSFVEMVEGEELVYIHEAGIATSFTAEEGKCTISFPVALSFQIPQITDGVVEASVMDDRGFESGFTTPGNPGNSFSVFPELYLDSFSFSDYTLNPTAIINVTGNFYLKNDVTEETIPFSYANIETIHLVDEAYGLVKDGINLTKEPEKRLLFDETEGFSFIYSFNETLSGTYTYYINLFLNESIDSVPMVSFSRHMSFTAMTHELLMNYLVLGDLRCRNYVNYWFGDGVYWQQSGEELSVKADVNWASPMDYELWVEGEERERYEGEVMVRTPEGDVATSDLVIVLRNETTDIHVITVEILEHSAIPGVNNPFGTYFITQGSAELSFGWDGEAPYLSELAFESLKNGSSVKSKDEELIVHIHEKKSFDNEFNEQLGILTLHWEGNISGSTTMTIVNKTDYWEGRGTIPFSQAKEDDVVFFWVSGNDSVGNPLESRIRYPHPSLLFDGTNNYSRAVAFVDPKPPSVPTGLKAKGNDELVELRWTPNTDGDTRGYYVYKRKEGETEYKIIVNRNSPVRYPYFKDEIVTNGVRYFYRVSAVDYALIPNESNLSEEVSATPEPEEEKDILTKVQSYATENFQMVFFGVVGLVVVAIMASVARRSRKEERKEKKREKKERRKKKKDVMATQDSFAPSESDLSTLEIKPFAPPKEAQQETFPQSPQMEPRGLPQQQPFYESFADGQPPTRAIPQVQTETGREGFTTCSHCNNIIKVKNLQYCIWCGEKL